MKNNKHTQLVDFGNPNADKITSGSTRDKTIGLLSDQEIWKWWQTQKFQKEQGEQEYTMLYELDLPKILKSFIQQFDDTQRR